MRTIPYMFNGEASFPCLPVSSWSVLICHCRLQQIGHHREQELRLLGQVRRITFYFFPLPVSNSFPLPTWRLRGRRSSVPIPITTTYAPSNWCYRFLSFLRGERPLFRSCYSRVATLGFCGCKSYCWLPSFVGAARCGRGAPGTTGRHVCVREASPSIPSFARQCYCRCFHGWEREVTDTWSYTSVI